MLRLTYRFYRFASAFNYHLPRRLTKPGLLAVIAMVLAGAVGSDIDQSVAFQGFALTFCLLTIGFASVPFFRGRFAIRRALPRLATVGQPFRYRVQVRNESARPYAGLELLEELTDPRPTFEEFAQLVRPMHQVKSFRLAPMPGRRTDLRPAVAKPAPLPLLKARGTAEAEVELLPLRRGPLRLRGTSVARRDPLGLVRSFVRVALPETVLILPRRYTIPVTFIPGHSQYQQGGVAMASSIGECEEFVSVREYRPGDPVRRIHWRSSARMARPIIKEYQDEYFARYGLVLDTFAGHDLDSFEEAVSVAASFACTLENQESLLDLLFIDSGAYCFTAGRGLARSQQMLEILACVRCSAQPRFQQLGDLVLEHAAVLSACVCVLVGWDEARRELIKRLRQTGLPVLVLIIAEKELKASADEEGAWDDQTYVLRPGYVAQDLQALAR